jgi:hypothetical protein
MVEWILERLAATVHVEHINAPEDLMIEVWETQGGGGTHTAVFNYGFWGPKQADEYKSLQPQSSVEAAISDAMRGLRGFFDPDIPPELMIWVKSVNNLDIIVDGNRRMISRAEAIRRRARKAK